jgi:O-acetyl-ADP-ribose deacetylase (regulator of RNase III)
MIIEKDADLLLEPVDAIGHFCNCCHIFGGLAGKIKQMYPAAYAADIGTPKNDFKKMGTFSYAVLQSNKHIYNIYTQYDIGMGRHTNYEAVYRGLERVNVHVLEQGLKSFGLPKNAGCGLGGADWRIVRQIIEVIFERSPLDLYICNYG